MNPTREKALDYAMELMRAGKEAKEIVYEARDIELYLNGEDRWWERGESGADAQATADLIGFPEMDGLTTNWEKVSADGGLRVVATPTPAVGGGVMVNGPGAAATTGSADGPPAAAAEQTSHAAKERSPRKPRKPKAKKAKAKRENKMKPADPVEPAPLAEPLNDELPHTEPMSEAA